jgi:hypothetical protein
MKRKRPIPLLESNFADIATNNNRDDDIIRQTKQTQKLNDIVNDSFIPHIITYGGYLPGMSSIESQEKKVVDFFKEGVYLHYPINIRLPSENSIMIPPALPFTQYPNAYCLEQMTEDIINEILHRNHPLGGPHSLSYKIACTLASTSRRFYHLIIPKIVEMCRFFHFIKTWVGKIAINTIYYPFGLCDGPSGLFRSPTWVMDFQLFTSFCQTIEMRRQKDRCNESTNTELLLRNNGNITTASSFVYTSEEFLRWEYIIAFYLSRITQACDSGPMNKALIDIISTLLTFLPRHIKYHHYYFAKNQYQPPKALEHQIPIDYLMEIFDYFAAMEFYAIPATTVIYNLFSKAILGFAITIADKVRCTACFTDPIPLFYKEYLGCQTDLSDFGWSDPILSFNNDGGISRYTISQSPKGCSQFICTPAIGNMSTQEAINWTEHVKHMDASGVFYISLEHTLKNMYHHFLSGTRKLFIHNILDTDPRLFSDRSQGIGNSFIRGNALKNSTLTIFYGTTDGPMITWKLIPTATATA